MKKTYLTPLTETLTAEFSRMVCVSPPTGGPGANWGNGQFDNEGYGEDEDIDDSEGDIDAQTKHFSVWD